MDAGIGPPSAMDPDRLGTDTLKSIFQMVLNRIAVRLALPSGKRGTVVGNDQLEPRSHLIVLTNLLLWIAVARDAQSIQVSLQDHLRRHLIDDLSRISRLLTTVAKHAIRRDGCETLIPRHNLTREELPQFLSQPAGFSGSF